MVKGMGIYGYFSDYFYSIIQSFNPSIIKKKGGK